MTASRVTDTLWVGDWQDAKATRETNPEITIVTAALDSPFIGDFHFLLVDGPAPSNSDIFALALAKVSGLQSVGALTLVHCVSGISRSCAIVVGYLMARDEIGYDVALAKLKELRPSANPNQFFVDILRRSKP